MLLEDDHRDVDHRSKAIAWLPFALRSFVRSSGAYETRMECKTLTNLQSVGARERHVFCVYFHGGKS